MRRLLAALALTGFFLGLSVHIATFFGIDISSRYPMVWLLHIGIFVVFIPMSIMEKRDRQIRNSNEFLANVPGWVNKVLTILFVYLLINFALFFYNSGGGSVREDKGVFILQKHGIKTMISAQEYHQQKVYILRGFSGHWLLFYLMPGLYFLTSKKDKTY